VDHGTHDLDFSVNHNLAQGSASYAFRNGKPVQAKPKFDMSNPQNRLRLESAIIAAKAVERRISSLEDMADFRKRSGQSSNKGPTANRYQEPNQNGAPNATESASHQSAVSMRPDISSGAQSKKTTERPTGDAASCACGQPRGSKCSCDKRIARSAIMDIKPSATIVPFATINKNLVAAETSAMSAMKKTIAQGLKSRGY
jgi:hypothetical protein